MTLSIVVIEDEPAVRSALARDLTPFAGQARIELAESVDDAYQVIDDIVNDDDVVALILSDHRLPGTTGVDFFIASTTDPRTARARRVLVTGQADQEDTIRAINLGHITHYVAKPWDSAELQQLIREELTEYVVAEEIDPIPLMSILDAPRVMQVLRRGPLDPSM